MSFQEKPHTEHAPAYARYYFDRASVYDDLMEALSSDLEITAAFVRDIPSEKGEFRYADDKWSTKNVIQHIIDTERVFQYRALRCSRKDSTPIAGFSEDHFAAHSVADSRSLEELAQEFECVRKATISLFRTMNDGMLDFVGEANGNPLSARSTGWMIVGHAIHHCGIIAERYLVDTDELY